MLQEFTNSRNNTFFFDGLENIQEKNGIFPDHHPNAYGAKKIAEDVYKYLKEQKIIYCN